ncbi:2Fe-2S iron-sulfur cluster-binding protein [Rhodococcus erythropolis]|uniref:2Fe-2S iron-sulfur cluster-binding protein n=1 Tax=Rhodococcus erythropolis TaxID=1833 RepID=UPI001BE6F83C|nr:2Fe-2S iron-sulfur cluster-binding protein [Rhodococcus erythropolis]MBT2266051.1 2Fe-2S iron-sulfur cluster binding domain-containing protein [Rhodococcus erythropolis]
MPKVTYIAVDGTEKVFDVDDGISVMKAAILNGVDGIVGECGGNLMCATCHVYVEPAWADRLAKKDEIEEEVLEEATSEVMACSRLSCQLVMGAETDGLVVRLPDSQA